MRSILLSLSAALVVSASANGQGPDSQTLAVEFSRVLAASGFSAFAAPVPDDASRFVGALHIPDVQLLVISARYPAPARLRELIARNDHREVYLDLNAAGERTGRFFVEDLGANGLRVDRERDTPFDITWREAVHRTLYNGSWEQQQLSENEYRRRYEKDAAEYANILQVLLRAHAAQTSSQPR